MLLIAMLCSCEECPECTPGSTSPGVRLAFYPGRTLDSVQATYDSIEQLLQQNRATLDTVEVGLRDSVAAVIEALVNDSTLYSGELADLRAGRLYIEQVSAVGGVSDRVFSDTLIDRYLYLPLNMNADVSLFTFLYLGRNDSLEVTYKRSLNDDLEGVRLMVDEVLVSDAQTSFDSVRLVCQGSVCDYRSTTVEIYY